MIVYFWSEGGQFLWASEIEGLEGGPFDRFKQAMRDAKQQLHLPSSPQIVLAKTPEWKQRTHES